MLRRPAKCVIAATIALCLRAGAQTAADSPVTQSSVPAPAYGQANAAVISPQNPPVSALDGPSLEPNLQPRSMLVGGVVGSEALDTNVNETANSSSSIHSVTRLLGGLTAQRLWERYNAAAAYVGGVGFYPNVNPTVRNIQELQGQGAMTWKTGQLTLRDSFSYLPDGTFGAGAYGGASGFQLGLGGLSQSSGLSGGSLGGHYGILGAGQYGSLGEVPRITNVTIADAIQELTPRSAITAAGSFGVIHFTGQNPSGFINSNQFGGDVGYSYAINRRDQVGIVYGFRAFRYPVALDVGGVDSHILQAIYGHRISGRMDLLIGAGPQWTIIKVPNQGSTTQISVSARASLRYRFERAAAAVSYLRINTTGSGFFAGAESDIVRISGSYDLARRWHARLDAGFSHNDRLQATTQPVNAGSFDYLFAGAGLEREFNRNLGAFLAYQYNYQVFGNCAGTNCNNRTSRQVIQFGASWHFRPIRLD